MTREDFKIRIPKEEPSFQEVSSTPRPIMEMFEPFIHEGSVALSSDLSDAVSVKILRDTGASQSLLLAETLPFSEKSSTTASVLIKGVNSLEYSPVPLHTVYLSSDLVSGPVNVGLGSSLPFEGVQLLLGNDLAVDKVVINPIVTDVPCVEQLPGPVEKEIPNLYPACAVTRAMSKKKLSDEDKDVDIADTFISQVFEETAPKNLSGTKSLEDDDISSLSKDVELNSRSYLIAEQHRDLEILPLFQRAVSENEVSQNPVCFFTKKWSFDEKMEATGCSS